MGNRIRNILLTLGAVLVGVIPSCGAPPSPEIRSSTLPLQLAWQFSVEGWKFVESYGVPDYANGQVIFWSDATIYALDGQTGEKKWEYNVGGFIYQVQVNGQAVAALAQIPRKWLIGDTLIVLNMEGQKVWERDGFFRSFCLGDGLVFAALEGYIRAYELATGKQVWENREAGESHFETTLFWGGDVLYVEGSNLRLLDPRSGEILQEITVQTQRTALFGDFLYTIDWSVVTITAIDRVHGRVIWSRPYYPSRDPFSRLTVVDGVIYVPNQRGSILAIRGEDGELIWRSPEGGDVLSNVVVMNGVVYAIFEDRTLRGFDAETGEEIGRLRFSGVGGVSIGGPVGIPKIGIAEDLLLVTPDSLTLFALQPKHEVVSLTTE